MSRTIRRAVAVAALLGLLAAGSAYAIQAEIGNTVVSATAALTPRALPAHGGAPVTVKSSVRIKTSDGSQPPALKSITFLFDKHGFIETKGVPVCTMAKLTDTTPAQARQRCAGALVGTGTGKARVAMPGQQPVTISSPLSFFNGPPSGGNPTLIAHAYETVPAPKTLLVPIEIKRVKGPRYGFRVEIEMPAIAEGFGAATLAEASVGRTFRRGGKQVGYINASCAGGRLQVNGALRFTNGDFFPATLVSACHTPR
jgi:hypothetical protein